MTLETNPRRDNYATNHYYPACTRSRHSSARAPDGRAVQTEVTSATYLVDNYLTILGEQWRNIDLAKWLVFVADDGRTIVGYIKGIIAKAMPIYSFKRVGFVEELVVETSRRKQGIGKALYGKLESAFQGETDRVMLHVMHGSQAVGFYENAGFKPIAFRMIKLLPI